MPRGGQAALVSEATAYRYFPDLVSLLQEALAGAWPDPAEALAPVAQLGRPGRAGRLRLRVPAPRRARLPGRGPRDDLAHDHRARPPRRTRPGIRFGLIDYALAPFERRRPAGRRPSPAAMTSLKQDLAVVVSAEAFFVLTDLCGLAARDAIASAARTAATLTSAAFAA